MRQRGRRTKVNSVGDIGGNIGSELGSVVGSAFFLKLFPKTGRKWILFNARKRFQVLSHIDFEQILFFWSFPWILEFKSILKLFPDYIQNSDIFRTRDILRTCQYTLWKCSILRFKIHSKSCYVEACPWCHKSLEYSLHKIHNSRNTA